MAVQNLSPKKFDVHIASDIVWTADAIGLLVGRSADYVRDTLAKLPGTPVRRIGRRYCASVTELNAFFRAPNPKQTQ